MIESILIWSTLVFDPLAGLIIVWGLLRNDDMKNFPRWHTFGLSLCAVGLFAQAYRSFVALSGLSPRDDELIFWVFKDLGLIVLAFTILITSVVNYMRRDE